MRKLKVFYIFISKAYLNTFIFDDIKNMKKEKKGSRKDLLYQNTTNMKM